MNAIFPCPNCRYELANSENIKFCPQCGISLKDALSNAVSNRSEGPISESTNSAAQSTSQRDEDQITKNPSPKGLDNPIEEAKVSSLPENKQSNIADRSPAQIGEFPISLDDAIALPRKNRRSTEKADQQEQIQEQSQDQSQQKSWRRKVTNQNSTKREPIRFREIVYLALFTLFLFGLVILYFQYHNGVIADYFWQKSSFDEGKIAIEFPGQFTEYEPELVDPVFQFAKGCYVKRPFEGVELFLMVNHLDQTKVASASLELIVNNRKAKENELADNKLVRESTVNEKNRQKKFTGIELEYRSPNGNKVIRYLMEEKRSPEKVYQLEIRGKKIIGSSGATTRFFNSFAVKD